MNCAMPSITHPEQSHHPRARIAATAAAAAEAGTTESTGTRSARPYTANTAAANRPSMQPTHREKHVTRPGITNAVVTTRTLPFGTARLHRPRHRARPVARRIAYTLGRALNDMRIRLWLTPHHTQHNQGSGAYYYRCTNEMIRR